MSTITTTTPGVFYDFDQEEEVMNAWVNHFDTPITFTKTEGDFCRHDFDVICEGRTAIVEVKVRKIASTRYRTTLIAESKLDYLSQAPVPSILIIKWTDCIGWLKIDGYPEFVKNSGARRIDRGLKCDNVQNVEIPISKFNMIRSK